MILFLCSLEESNDKWLNTTGLIKKFKYPQREPDSDDDTFTNITNPDDVPEALKSVIRDSLMEDDFEF
jgi:hypothetical protein